MVVVVADIMSVIIVFIQVAIVSHILLQSVEDARLEAHRLHQQVSNGAVLVTLHHLFQFTYMR